MSRTTWIALADADARLADLAGHIRGTLPGQHRQTLVTEYLHWQTRAAVYRSLLVH